MAAITKRGEGTYRLTVSLGSDLKGKPIRKTKTVHVANKREAEKEWASFLLECQELNPIALNDFKVSEFADLWWREYVVPQTKRSTRSGYRTALYHHFLPTFKEAKLQEIKPLQIQHWMNELQAQGCSAKTVKNYVSVISHMFSAAVKWEYLRRNPCEKVDLPKRTKTEAAYYSEENVLKLLGALSTVKEEDMNYKVAVFIGLFGGLRKGEILGLNEDDYDPRKKELYIRRTRMIGNGVGPYEDTPKTERSIRVIGIPDEVAQEIDNLLKYQEKQKSLWKNKWQGSKALIKGNQGQAMYPQNLQRWFTRFIERNGLPKLTLHGLRHTHTALLASMTGDVSQISRRLGHSNKTTTLNTYVHLFRDNDKKLTKKISDAFFREKDDAEPSAESRDSN